MDPAFSTAQPGNPALIGPSDLASPGQSTSALMALPLNPPPLVGKSGGLDTGTSRKFYTISVDLREIYDDNARTSHTNPVSSLETSLSPSILVDFPMNSSEFSARYTLTATYYGNIDSNNNNNNQSFDGGSGPDGTSFQLQHEFVAQFQHTFSDRFSMNAAEQFRVYTEPSLDQSTGTNYRNGEYISNSLTGNLTSQWTPLLGSTTSLADTVVHYETKSIADFQDNVENTGSHVFSLSVLPKLNVNFGGTVDNIVYTDAARGYTSYTGFGGLSWQALPSLSVSGRAGLSYTQTKVASIEGADNNNNDGSFAPYGALSVNWAISDRSNLSADYSHEVSPTSQTGASGQQSDRFSVTGNYNFNSNISGHVQGVFTYAQIPQSLVSNNTISTGAEEDYILDAGAAYHFNKYFDVTFDITLSGVSADDTLRSYSRTETSIGIRGTY